MPGCGLNCPCVRNCACVSESECAIDDVGEGWKVIAIVVPILVILFLGGLVACHFVAKKRRKQRAQLMQSRNAALGNHLRVQPEQNFISLGTPQTNYFPDYSRRINGVDIPIQNYSIGQPINPHATNIVHYGQPEPQLNAPSYFLKPGTMTGYSG